MVRKRIRQQGFQGSFSINISSRSLLDWRFPGDVLNVANRHNESLAGFVFEVTESAQLSDEELSGECIAELKDLGVELSLDDFWTGYSSIEKTNLDRFGEVKVDYSLTKRVTQDRIALAGIASIITFAKNLNWRCVVEGIEAPQTLSRLMAIGCQIGQGYLFTRPLMEDQFTEWYVAKTKGGTIDLPVQAADVEPDEVSQQFDEDTKRALIDHKTPIWVFNADRTTMVWANTAGLEFWMAESVEELCARDFSDISFAVKERLAALRIQLEHGGTVARHWTVFPRNVPKPVYTVFERMHAIGGDFLLLARGFEGFSQLPERLNFKEIADATPIACIAATKSGAVYWRNTAAIALAGRGIDQISDIADDKREMDALLHRIQKAGEASANISIRGPRCVFQARVVGRKVRDSESGEWSLIVNLLPICELTGTCGWSGVVLPREIAAPSGSAAPPAPSGEAKTAAMAR